MKRTLLAVGIAVFWEWWGVMAGALSIPFMLFGLFNVSQRLLFFVLAYVALCLLVISQKNEIARLRSHTKKPEIAAYDDFDELLKEGDEMLERFKKNKPPLPTQIEFDRWDQRLITLAGSCATIPERNRLRDGSPMEIKNDAEMMQLYMDIPEEHHDIGVKLASKLKVSREIMKRLRSESSGEKTPVPTLREKAILRSYGER